ncbi:MAG: phytoene desaturase family protein, partial [Rudaea sp.]
MVTVEEYLEERGGSDDDLPVGLPDPLGARQIVMVRTSNEQRTREEQDRSAEPSGTRPPSAVARRSYDAVVVGAGPNGLAAGITLARQGRRVLILEAQPTVGGGARTAELTLPGFRHDICSAVHPLGIGSPFFRSLPLDQYGLEWIQPATPLAHPFDDGTAAVLERSVRATAEHLGADGAAYRRLIGPLVDRWNDLTPELLAPFHIPRHPLTLGRFGLLAVLPGAL